MVRDGLLSAEEAQHHENRNVLTAALGIDSESVSGDFPVEPIELQPEDIILICTDGLHGLVSDAEMALSAEKQSLTEACRNMTALAKMRGGPDNITLQLLRIRHLDS
jgi:protein phosphatase